MKVHLMYRDRDFDQAQELPLNEATLTQDLELETLLDAMAGGDEFWRQVARHAVLTGLQQDGGTMCYRQAIMQDCLHNGAVVRQLYDLAGEAIEGRRGHWWLLGPSPRASSVLYGAVGVLKLFVAVLAKLRQIADAQADQFASEGFRAFVARLREELTQEYLAAVTDHLRQLAFRDGVLLSAQLGKGNEGTNYLLRQSLGKRPNWLQRLFARRPDEYTYRLDPRDEAGGRALSELRDRGIREVADTVARSVDHVLNFFVMLRTELAFYLGGVRLHRQLTQKGVPVCFPTPLPSEARGLSCAGLRDAALALHLEREVIGNDVAADGKDLVVITGANQGGKSTLLRSVGQAQVMMQCGLFVAAESFHASVCRRLFTHYKREEDPTMQHGRLDEELSRMARLAEALTPDSLLLLNESFSATNEREGSEIARQVIQALVEAGVRVFFVTHLGEFARGLWEEGGPRALFLRAERQADGRRTFRVLPGEPLETSFGADLYGEVFGGVVEAR